MLSAHPNLATARDEAGNSPVLMATYMGKPDIVRLLLDRGARPSFFEACALGLEVHVRQVVRVLLDAGADRSLRSGDGQTAREIASQHGRHEIARLLSP